MMNTNLNTLKMNNFSIPEQEKEEGETSLMRTIFLWEAFINKKGNVRFIRQVFSKTDRMKQKEKEDKKEINKEEIKQKDKILVTESDEIEF